MLGLLAGAGVVRGDGLSGLVHHWNFDQGPDWHDDGFGAASAAVVAPDLVGVADLTFRGMDGGVWVSGRQYTGVALDGVDRLRLILTDAGDGNRLDAGDWCDPSLYVDAHMEEEAP